MSADLTRLSFNYYGNNIDMIDTKENCMKVFEEVRTRSKEALAKFKDIPKEVLAKDFRINIKKISTRYKESNTEMTDEDRLIFMISMMGLSLMECLDNTRECGIVLWEEDTSSLPPHTDKCD